MSVVKSNAGKTKGKLMGWAFKDPAKAEKAAKKHAAKNPTKPKPTP